RSMLIPLYTETGIVPLRVRCFILALGYCHLQYLLSLLPSHFACTAVNSSIKLAAAGKKSWAKDLMTAASKLPFECPGPDLANTTAVSILDYTKMVDGLMLEWIQGEGDSSNKLHLIQGGREPQKDKSPAPQTLRLQHYLSMLLGSIRLLLTSLLLSTHLLAIEVLRWRDHMQPREDDHARCVCRFCKVEVETLEHALLACDTSIEVVSLHAAFLEKLFITAPNLRQLVDELDDIEFFKSMVYERSTVALVAKFAHKVLQVFYATPVFRLAG
ncbi:hypothetical protein B0H17DRAFT_937128, partial [Mycena rosella]